MSTFREYLENEYFKNAEEAEKFLDKLPRNGTKAYEKAYPKIEEAQRKTGSYGQKRTVYLAPRKRKIFKNDRGEETEISWTVKPKENWMSIGFTAIGSKKEFDEYIKTLNEIAKDLKW